MVLGKIKITTYSALCGEGGAEVPYPLVNGKTSKVSGWCHKTLKLLCSLVAILPARILNSNWAAVYTQARLPNKQKCGSSIYINQRSIAYISKGLICIYVHCYRYLSTNTRYLTSDWVNKWFFFYWSIQMFTVKLNLSTNITIRMIDYGLCQHYTRTLSADY